MARSLWLLFLLLKFSYGIGLVIIGCPSPSYCTCDHIKITCVGNEPTSAIDIGLFQPHDQPSLFIIRGFHMVKLKVHFLQRVRPNTLIISNITNLFIDSLAFVGSGDMDHLELSHINHLSASQFSFYQLTDNRKIIFRNVKIQSLLNGAISIINSEFFSIDDCDFGIISSNAVMISNVTRAILNNTRIQSIELNSFSIFGTDSTESLTLQNVSIANISKSSFQIAFTPEVKIVNCNLGTVNSKFVSGTDIDTFSFLGNVINDSQSDLFENMNATYLVVKNNTFRNLQSTSLTLHTIQENLSFEMNAFYCNCDNWWLWDASENFLQNNKCQLNSSADFISSVPLADFEPIWTNGNGSTCSGLHQKKVQESSVGDAKEETNGKAQKGQAVSKMHSNSSSFLEMRSVVLMIFISFFTLLVM